MADDYLLKKLTSILVRQEQNMRNSGISIASTNGDLHTVAEILGSEAYQQYFQNISQPKEKYGNNDE